MDRKLVDDLQHELRTDRYTDMAISAVVDYIEEGIFNHKYVAVQSIFCLGNIALGNLPRGSNLMWHNFLQHVDLHLPDIHGLLRQRIRKHGWKLRL